MVVDLSPDIARTISRNSSHDCFSRLGKINPENGSYLKSLLPICAQENSILIIDTNFADPLKGIDITRYLLEYMGVNNNEKNVAKYILKATYGEMKYIFETVKNGQIISPPHIQTELAKRNEAMDVAIHKSSPPFNEIGYFLQFYGREESKQMAHYAKGIVNMNKGLLGRIQNNGNRFSDEFKRAEKVASAINSKYSLPKKPCGESASIEDIIISSLGIFTPNSMLCTDDSHCYSVLNFIKKQNINDELCIPLVCSSTQIFKIGEQTFQNKFGRYQYNN